MKGICLKICVNQFHKHEETGILLYEWLLEKAKKLGVSGGFACLSLASFGHRGHLRESHFYELGGGNLTVEVTFALSEELANELLSIIKTENLNLFFIKLPAEYGFTV